jgi:hypothetical protein
MKKIIPLQARRRDTAAPRGFSTDEERNTLKPKELL